jgi:hypothetical protein
MLLAELKSAKFILFLIVRSVREKFVDHIKHVLWLLAALHTLLKMSCRSKRAQNSELVLNFLLHQRVYFVLRIFSAHMYVLHTIRNGLNIIHG